MKRQYVPITLLLFIVFIGMSALHAQHYDDLYYNPQTDYAHYYGSKKDYSKSEKEKEDLSRNAEESDQDSFNDDDDYDGYFYSSRIRRFHRPARFYYYDMWSSPFNYYDPWAVGPSIGFYGNGFSMGYGFNSWNNWNNPWCNNGWNNWNNPWCNNGWNNSWNNGFGNSWGMGNNVIINNYYGNGWYGNGWSPYHSGWNNPYDPYNHPYSGGNWGGGGQVHNSNPKGTVKGPRQTGGVSTPTPPVRYQNKESNPIKNGRDTRVNTGLPEAAGPSTKEPKRNNRANDINTETPIKERNIDRSPQFDQPKRNEQNRQIEQKPQFDQPKRNEQNRQIEPKPQFDQPKRNDENREIRRREPDARQDRTPVEQTKRKNTAENTERRFNPPARSNDYERSYEQPRQETRSENRSFDSNSRNSNSNRGATGNNTPSTSGSGRRGRN